ncbi:MAG: endonuclease III [Candidatus Verstraetearchaeota archaeon]|jgi:endonuclease-3|uniref:Endonuclease III n=1 Tax=Thermoproteota archaeon TaxID=2056631 RepID=A0A523BFD0_9CREN|nr:endonuclease III [Candidatus Methanomethylicia archaeon]NHV60920.1 endonuclease III [Candidatus Verstraetearchaeota archaeon]TDA39180.1 MAG: endonuclease III [Candidatus Verstraetearchaeota archaeon]
MRKVKFPKELIPELEERYSRYWWKDDEELDYNDIVADPFKNLIFTILSQNTSSSNTRRAYVSLKRKYQINPAVLSRADPKELSQVIRTGGLQNIKAERIVQVSRLIMENYGGDLRKVLSFPKEKVREELKKLKGVGDKTADVLLSSIFGQREYFVVDTHMMRIAKRLGIVDEGASYEEVQSALKDFLPLDVGGDRLAGLFWLLAKYTCDAKKPKCQECLLKGLCRYSRGRGS